MLEEKRKTIVATMVDRFEALIGDRSVNQRNIKTSFQSYIRMPSQTSNGSSAPDEDSAKTTSVNTNIVPCASEPKGQPDLYQVKQQTKAQSDVENKQLNMGATSNQKGVHQLSLFHGDYVNLEIYRKEILKKLNHIDIPMLMANTPKVKQNDSEEEFKDTPWEKDNVVHKHTYENIWPARSFSMEDISVEENIYENVNPIGSGLPPHKACASDFALQQGNGSCNLEGEEVTREIDYLAIPPARSCNSQMFPTKIARKRCDTSNSDVDFYHEDVASKLEGEYVTITEYKPVLTGQQRTGEKWNSSEELHYKTMWTVKTSNNCNPQLAVSKIKLTKDQVEKEEVHKFKDVKELIVDELITTEENYIVRLQYTKNNFQDWLSDQIGEHDTTDMFNKLDLICEETHKLLTAIKSVRGDYEAIGLKFIQHKNWFERYPVYCRNIKKAKEITKKHQHLIKMREDELNNDLELRELLLLPINRLGKYELLLSKLHKYLAKQNLPAANIHGALERIHKIADKCNIIMELDCIRNKPRHYHYRCTGKFLLRGNFRQLAPCKTNVVLFLFEKKIIITKLDHKKKDNYFFVDDISIDELGINKKEPRKRTMFSLIKYENIFSLIKYEKPKTKIYRLDGQDICTTEKWVQTVTKLLWEKFEEEKRKRCKLNET